MIKLVVIESFNHVSKSVLKKYIRNSMLIYLIEPFVAYHHTSKRIYHGFPDAFPDYVEQFLHEGLVKLLPEKLIDGKTIYRQGADKSVEVIESLYHEYRKEHKELIEYVSEILKSSIAENAFKKDLCNRLAEFYSVNIMLHRIGELFNSKQVIVYPDINVRTYLYLKSLLSRSNQEFFAHPNISFPKRTYIASFFEDTKEYFIAVIRLSIQTLASGLFSGLHSRQKKRKRSYSYGITIISPSRQFADSRRGPGFLIDNHKIKAEDVVYLPLVGLNDRQKKQLSGEVCYLPKAGRYFSHFAEWAGLLRVALKKNLLRNAREINTACNVFFNYFRWLKMLKDIKLRHFITHCDFGISHIGRNIALKQAGIQTWYFTDSMNFGCNFKMDDEKCDMRHPFWTYLCYDHFITWDVLIEQYFNSHPGTFRHTHVVGCLWSEHINRQDKAENKTVNVTLKNLRDSFKLVAFDTSYSKNGFTTSYSEGIAFAEHLLQLADTFPDVYIVLKEKKVRNIHSTFDPVIGPRLIELYNKIDTHPRMTVCSDRADSSGLISIADIVVSFPFTSTTFEALSVSKPAIWHDPMGYYRNTLYGKINGIMTHSYDELKNKIKEIKDMQSETWQNPIPINSVLMDPYRDGKAIDRFRNLLTLDNGERREEKKFH